MMENNLTPEEVDKIKNELIKTQEELKVAKEQQYIVQQNPQDKFLETLFDKGGEILKVHLQTNTEKEKYLLDKQTEYDKEELKTVDTLDSRDKLFKGVLLSVSIAALGLLAYFEKAQSVAPVLGVVIGLLLKTSSITDFFSGGKSKFKGSEGEG